MYKIFNLIFFIFFLSIPLSSLANKYIEKTVEWYKLKYIQYQIWDSDYTLQVGISDEDTNLMNLTNSYWWITSLNWVYFCPSDYSSCGGYSHTINERYVEGKKIAPYNTTWDRVVFAWGEDMTPFIFQTDQINPDKELHIYEWFANFPLIMKDWKDMVEYYRDNYLMYDKLRDEVPRHFICWDKEKKNIYFWVIHDIDLDKMWLILSKIWCHDALNLDAGRSRAFIYNGKYIAGPGRDILDALIIKRKWLNTYDIREKTDIVLNRISKLINWKTKEQKIYILEYLRESISKLVQDIYEDNSENIFDEEWKKIWYTLDIKDLRELKKVYLLNSLEYSVKEMIDEINDTE